MLDLTDRKAVNEAVAKAMGHPVKRNCLGALLCGCGRCEKGRGGYAPDYLGDDPVLNREMLKALIANTARVEVAYLNGNVYVAWRTTDVPPESQNTNWCNTRADALVQALDAAGLLEEADE